MKNNGFRLKILMSSLLVFMFFAGAVISIVLVLAAKEQETTSNISVRYTVDGVEAEVSAKYVLVSDEGNVGEKISMINNNHEKVDASGKVLFKVEDNSFSGDNSVSLEVPVPSGQANNKINISKDVNKVVYEFYVKNLSESMFVVELNDDYELTSSNMDVRFRASRRELSGNELRGILFEKDDNDEFVNTYDTFLPQPILDININEERDAYIYMTVSVHNTHVDASVSGTINWNLKFVEESEVTTLNLDNDDNGTIDSTMKIMKADGYAMPMQYVLPEQGYNIFMGYFKNETVGGEQTEVQYIDAFGTGGVLADNLSRNGNADMLSARFYTTPFIFGDKTYTKIVGLNPAFLALGTTSITVPAQVTEICDNALCDASNLVEIDFEQNHLVGASAFASSSFIKIGNFALSGCTNLQRIYLPSTIEEIGNFAFENCSSINELEIPESASMGITVLSGCTALEELTFPYVFGNQTSSSSKMKYLFGSSGAPSSLTTVVVNSATNDTIGDCAFYWCSGLEELTIPSSVTNIGNYAFYFCSGLEEFTIPSSVTSIGTNILQGCGNSLISLEFPYIFTSSQVFIGSSAIRYLIGQNTPVSLTTVVVNSATNDTIGDYAFAGCNKLTSITIPSSVTNIGNYAFNWCEKLTSAPIPSGVTTIGNYAFWRCYELKNITIPSGVTSIGNEAFNGCSGVTNLTIPASVESIGNYAFGCSMLVQVRNLSGFNLSNYGYSAPSYAEVIETNAEFTSNLDFDAVGGKYTIFTNGAYKVLFKANDKAITSADDIPSDINYIGNYAFYECTGLASITIPNSVTVIGQAAMAYCSSLTELIIPNSVTTIVRDAFGLCTSLTEITIPSSVTSVGNLIFSGCTGLKKAIILSPTAIDYGMFEGCSSLEEVVLPDVRKLSNYMFPYCTALKEITISNSVESIGNNTFAGCTNLETINFTGTQAQWALIKKGTNTIPSGVTIVCTDGNITIS